MQKPDWKVAVIGGSIAALGLGGFAAAQTGGGTSDTTVPDGIRLQRDASVSVQSLSSIVQVAPETSEASATTSLATLASIDSASVQSASLDSVPQVAPAPQPAPAQAPAPRVDDSIDSPDSIASMASVDSVDSSS